MAVILNSIVDKFCSVSKMILKLSVPIIFLFVTIVSATKDFKKDGGPFSIENAWKKSTRSTSRRNPNWTKGVQKYYDDIIVAFGSFPREVSKEAELVKTTLQTIMTKAVRCSNSESKILSTGATKVLEAFNQVKLDDHTAQGVITEFSRVLPTLMTSYRGAVKDLKKYIGSEKVCAVNKAITNAECAFQSFIKEFNAGDRNGFKKEIDYEPVMKCIQKLTNTISNIGEEALTKRELATPEFKDALIVLSLVLEHILICVHGLSSSCQSVLLEQNCKPKVLDVCVAALLGYLSKMSKSVDINTIPNAENVPAHLQNVVNITRKLNLKLKNVFGMVKDVNPAVAQIIQKSSDNIENITNGFVKSLRLIEES